MTGIKAQSRISRKLDIDFAAPASIRGGMSSNQEHTPECIIERLLLAGGLLMEETSPDLAVPVEPTPEALEGRIELVERTASELDAIAATARAILRLVQK